MSRTSGSTQPDGRTARRDRNSDAVLDAVHELFVEGQLVPTVEEVAARSGVSTRLSRPAPQPSTYAESLV